MYTELSYILILRHKCWVLRINPSPSQLSPRYKQKSQKNSQKGRLPRTKLTRASGSSKTNKIYTQILACLSSDTSSQHSHTKSSLSAKSKDKILEIFWNIPKCELGPKNCTHWLESAVEHTNESISDNIRNIGNEATNDNEKALHDDLNVFRRKLEALECCWAGSHNAPLHLWHKFRLSSITASGAFACNHFYFYTAAPYSDVLRRDNYVFDLRDIHNVLETCVGVVHHRGTHCSTSPGPDGAGGPTVPKYGFASLHF